MEQKFFIYNKRYIKSIIQKFNIYMYSKAKDERNETFYERKIY